MYYGVDVRGSEAAAAAAAAANADADAATADAADADAHAHLVRALESHTLNLFDDALLNRHLVYSLVELLVLALMPELACERDGM